MSAAKHCADVHTLVNAHSHITQEDRTLLRTLPAHSEQSPRTLENEATQQSSLKALAGAVLKASMQCANVQTPRSAQPHITPDSRTIPRTLSAQCNEMPRTFPAHCDEVDAHYQETAWAEFEALLLRVAPYYQAPAPEYAEIREAAMRDLDGALASYRLMAKELTAGDIDDALPEERHRCTECANLTQRGRCMAAQRGEIDHVSFFEPVQDVLRRCGGFTKKEERKK